MNTENKTFGGIELSPKLMSSIIAMGFEEPSPIQAATIPLVLSGRDVIGQAQTGTGKTAAFGIPAIELINTHRRFFQVLVLSPTRELAIQTAEELNKIGAGRHAKTVPIYGGQAIERQIKALKSGPQIIVGTPGRLLDHIRRETIKLDRVQILVLDEADEMLDMGFVEDIEAIMDSIKTENRQTLLFSATMPEPIAQLAQKYLNNPERVTISRENLTVPAIEQYYYETRDKLDGLCRVLDVEDTGKLIIFSKTKKGVDDLSAALQARGYQADSLHGDLSQMQRDRVMKRFRTGKIDMLVATDVAARGIDIDDITHVINYDIPQDHEAYVHRIGRTGRAGRAGVAMTFIIPREYRQLRLIQRLANTKIIRRDLPSTEDILESQRGQVLNKLRLILSRQKYEAYHSIVAELADDGYDMADVAAAAVQLSIEGISSDSAKDAETNEFSNTGGAKGMVRFFLNVGRNQHIRPGDIVRAFAQEADIPGNLLGTIDMYDKFTFVDVPEKFAERALNVMHRNKVKGYKISVEPARKENTNGKRKRH